MKFLLVVALLMMAGCAATPPLAAAGTTVIAATPAPAAPATSDPLALLRGLTADDVAQALTIAKIAGDADGVQCFTSLQSHLADGTLSLPLPKGLVSGFELARVIDLKLRVGLPKDLIQACAVYTFDMRTFAARLGLAGAIAGALP